jgi:hypothetical protein
MVGTVYILTNEAMPGLIKIGQTQGSVADRMRQLDTTSIPLPFECFYAVEVPDPARAERAIHDAFDDHRIRKSREYFRISPDRPKAILELVQIRNVTPGEEVLSEPGDQVALDRARDKRSKFNFSMINLKEGDVLTSVFDESVEAIVSKEKNLIDFRGELSSLSAAALKVAHEKGYGWKSIAGPSYWKFAEKTLSERRDEIEEIMSDL